MREALSGRETRREIVWGEEMGREGEGERVTEMVKERCEGRVERSEEEGRAWRMSSVD